MSQCLSEEFRFLKNCRKKWQDFFRREFQELKLQVYGKIPAPLEKSSRELDVPEKACVLYFIVFLKTLRQCNSICYDQILPFVPMEPLLIDKFALGRCPDHQTKRLQT